MSSIEKYAKKNGLRMENAKVPLMLEVEQSDVSKSKRNDPSNCAFANAACNHLRGVKAAHFFKSTAWLEYDKKLVRYSLPPSIQKEIVAFDRSRKLMPGVYQLAKASKPKPPTPPSRRGKKNPSSKRGKLRHQTTNVRASIIVE